MILIKFENAVVDHKSKESHPVYVQVFRKALIINYLMPLWM